jgi:hypothetical protein
MDDVQRVLRGECSDDDAAGVNLEADELQRGHVRLNISFPSLHALNIATWLVPSRPNAEEPTILDWRWLSAVAMRVWRRLKPETTASTRTPHPSIRKFSWGQQSGWMGFGVVSLSTQFWPENAADSTADERLQPIKPW